MHVRRRYKPSPVWIILRLNHGFLREDSTLDAYSTAQFSFACCQTPLAISGFKIVRL